MIAGDSCVYFYNSDTELITKALSDPEMVAVISALAKGKNEN